MKKIEKPYTLINMNKQNKEQKKLQAKEISRKKKKYTPYTRI